MTQTPLPETYDAVNVLPRLWWDQRNDYCEAKVWVEYLDQTGPFETVCLHAENFSGPLCHEDALEWMAKRLQGLPFELL